MPETWPAKDPDAVFDYTYRIPLDDDGDNVVTYDLELLAGTIAIDSGTVGALAAAPAIFTDPETGTAYRAQAVTPIWLSGGTDGEIAVLRISWVTAAGREDDDVITLPIAAHEPEALILTGYVKPSIAHLIARYPAFADVAPATIAMWLLDAERFVDTSWLQGDYAAGLMALAAHNMALGGLGASDTTLAGIPTGITNMRSADLSLTFSEGAVKGRISGSLDSTIYGSEYAIMLRRNKSGPRVMATGAVPCFDYPYPMGAW